MPITKSRKLLSELDWIVKKSEDFLKRAEETTVKGMLAAHFQTQPDVPFFIPDTQARAFGFDVPDLWQVKATRNVETADINFFSVSPEGWVIEGDDSFRSPEGQLFTFRDIDAFDDEAKIATGLFKPGAAVTDTTFDVLDEFLTGVTPEGVSQYNIRDAIESRVDEALLIEAFGEESFNIAKRGPIGLVWDSDSRQYVQATMDLSITKDFYQQNPELLPPGVSPAITPEELELLVSEETDRLDQLSLSLETVVPEFLATLPEDQKINATVAFINQILFDEEVQGEFLDAVLVAGKTPDTVVLLKAVGFNDDNINEFYGIQPEMFGAGIPPEAPAEVVPPEAPLYEPPPEGIEAALLGEGPLFEGQEIPAWAKGKEPQNPLTVWAQFGEAIARMLHAPAISKKTVFGVGTPLTPEESIEFEERFEELKAPGIDIPIPDALLPIIEFFKGEPLTDPEKARLDTKGLATWIPDLIAIAGLPKAIGLKAFKQLAPIAGEKGLTRLGLRIGQAIVSPLAAQELIAAGVIKYGIAIPLKYTVKGVSEAGTKAFNTLLDAGLDRWLVQKGVVLPANQNRLIRLFLSKNSNWLYRRAQANLKKRMAERRGETVAAKMATEDTILEAETLLLKAAEETGIKIVAVKPVTEPTAVVPVKPKVTPAVPAEGVVPETELLQRSNVDILDVADKETLRWITPEGQLIGIQGQLEGHDLTAQRIIDTQGTNVDIPRFQRESGFLRARFETTGDLNLEIFGSPTSGQLTTIEGLVRENNPKQVFIDINDSSGKLIKSVTATDISQVLSAIPKAQPTITPEVIPTAPVVGVTPTEVVVPEVVPKPIPSISEVAIEPTPTPVITEGGVPLVPTEPIPTSVVENTPIIGQVGAKEDVRAARLVFNRLGLYTVHRGIQKAEVELGEARVVRQKEINELRKTIPDKSRWSVIFDEVNEAGSVKGLTFQEKRVVSYVKKWADKWADIKNLPKDQRIKDYIPHLFDQEAISQLKERGSLPPELAAFLDEKVTKKITDPFLKKRLGAVGWLKDPFKAMEAYDAVSLRVLHYEPFLQKIAQIANDPATHSTVRRYLKDYSRRMTGEMSNFDEKANVNIAALGEKIAKLPGGEFFAKHLTKGNPAGMATYNMTSVLYTLWLGFKATSAIRNLGQHTLIIGEVGPENFAKGVALRFTSEGKAALKESLVWRSRKAAFVPGIDDSFTARWTDEFREKALWMFRKADEQNVKDAFLAGYSEAKSLLPDADPQVWYDRGDEVAADTQYLYTKMNSMALSQTSLGRVFSVLTTWTANWLELMTKWISRRPSQVYLQYEKATGTKIPKKNWSQTYKAVVMYLVIVGLAYAIKERTRLKAFEYVGVTSLRYLGDVLSGDFPGLSMIGPIARLITSFLTDDEKGLKAAWTELSRTLIPSVVHQLEDVASGAKDWMTLLFYLEGEDYFLKQLKEDWEKDVKGYTDLKMPEDTKGMSNDEKAALSKKLTRERADYRVDNPGVEAKLFVTNQLTTLSSEAARQQALQFIKKHNLDTEMIKGYQKIFGRDTDKEFTDAKKLLGKVELDDEGKQKVKENGELDYYTTSNFASEVNATVKVVGKYQVLKDNNPLAVEYLRAKDSFVQYDNLTEEGRVLFRQQFPDVEAQMYLWGHKNIQAFKNPTSAKILLALMDKYDIPPESIPAFLDDPGKYDELFTEKFKLQEKWFELDSLYKNYGNSESDIYIEDIELRKEARANLKDENIEWVTDTARIQAIDHDATPEITTKWADREKIVSETSGNSPQAKKWAIDNPASYDWAVENNLLQDTKESWNVPVVFLQVKWQEKDDIYNDIDADAINLVTGVSLREEYLAANDEYRMDRRRREAYLLDFPDTEIENFVKYYELLEKGKRQERFLLDNLEFADAMHDLKGMDIPTSEDVPPVGYDETYEKWLEQFAVWEGLADFKSEFYIEDTDARDIARDKLFADDPDFYYDFKRWEAYGKKDSEGNRFTEDEVNLYADYFVFSDKGFRRKRMLVENPEFADKMHTIQNIDIPLATDVPSVKYDDIYDQFKDTFDLKDSFSDVDSKNYKDGVVESPITGRTAREQAVYELRFNKNGTMTEFGKAEIVRNGYGMFVPQEYIARWEDWGVQEAEGRRDDWPTVRNGNPHVWYEDEWYLIDNPKFYKDVYVDIMGNQDYLNEKDKDGVLYKDKVPTREVFDLYVRYEKLGSNKERIDFRYAHRNLDNWGVLKFGWTPIYEIKKLEFETPSGKIERILRELEELLK